jgi:transaldolase
MKNTYKGWVISFDSKRHCYVASNAGVTMNSVSYDTLLRMIDTKEQYR